MAGHPGTAPRWPAPGWTAVAGRSAASPRDHTGVHRLYEIGQRAAVPAISVNARPSRSSTTSTARARWSTASTGPPTCSSARSRSSKLRRRGQGCGCCAAGRRVVLDRPDLRAAGRWTATGRHHRGHGGPGSIFISATGNYGIITAARGRDGCQAIVGNIGHPTTRSTWPPPTPGIQRNISRRSTVGRGQPLGDRPVEVELLNLGNAGNPARHVQQLHQPGDRQSGCSPSQGTARRACCQAPGREDRPAALDALGVGSAVKGPSQASSRRPCKPDHYRY